MSQLEALMKTQNKKVVSAAQDDHSALESFLAAVPPTRINKQTDNEVVLSSSADVLRRVPAETVAQPASAGAFNEIYTNMPLWVFTSTIANAIIVNGKRVMLPYRTQDPALAAGLVNFYAVNAPNALVRIQTIKASTWHESV